jgi:peroxiredoxin
MIKPGGIKIWFFIFGFFLLMFFLTCSSEDKTNIFDDIPIVTFTSEEMNQITIPLNRVDSHAEILADADWPSIDFEDRGWISKEPLEKNLTGVSENLKINFYGIFELSDANFILSTRKSKDIENLFWTSYDKEQIYDSKISFINGFDQNEREFFCFDANNDEDFSNDKIIYPEEFSQLSRILSYFLPNIACGQKCNAKVEFEYYDEDTINKDSISIQVVRFDEYVKPRKDPLFPKFRGEVLELRVGRLNLDGDIINLAIYNDGDFATYHAKISSMIIFDLNNDGVFENDFESIECYELSKPFNINGITFNARYISAFADRVVLKKSDSTVSQKIEIIEGVPAPNFQFIDLQQKKYSLNDYRGQYVLLDFWSSYCYFCMEDLPELKQIYNEFNSDNFVFIGFNGDRKKDVALNTIKNKNIEWTQILDHIENNEIARKSFNVWGEPRYFLIDPEGQIIMKSSSAKKIHKKLKQIF